ncbi:MAG: hypothetical protein H7123_00140 [Thermoleophilia bacterium]|nr:hypothetical protein [Thermoleophilia bacterium]
MNVISRTHRLLPRFTYANVVATIALVVAVGTGSAFALTVTGAQIKDSTVTTKDLKDLTVGSRDLATSAVSAAKLATNAVSSTKIADGAITSTKIGDGSVTDTKLSNSAVTSSRILDGGVTSGDLADGSVGRSKLAANAVSNSQLDVGLTVALQKDVTYVPRAGPVNVPIAPTATTIEVSCGATDLNVIGAGVKAVTPGNLTIRDSYPMVTDPATDPVPTHWIIEVTSTSTPNDVTAWAVCI